MTALATEPLPIVARLPAVSSGQPNFCQPPTATAPALREGGDALRLVDDALTAPDVSAVWQRLVDGLAGKFGVTAAIGWQRPGRRRWLGVVSGRGVFDRRTDLGRAIEAAAAETWLQARPLRWPGEHAPCAAPPTYRQLATQTGAARVLGVPLPTPGGDPPAVLLLWGEAEPCDRLPVDHALGELARPLAGVIRILAHATPTAWTAVGRRLSALVHGRRRWLALLLGISLGVLSLVPVPDRVSCTAALEPQLRRFVIAPFEGTLEKSLVKAGDHVAQGQTLALLDQRPLHLELSVLQGECDEAGKRRDAARAKGQASAAQLADLEVAQAAAKIAHLRHQLEQLTIASPLDGVVVRGDLQRVEGAPLARGQSLFEVAPLSPLVAELAVPEDEVQLVAAGMHVSLWLAARPGRTLSGTIARVHPQAEIRNGQSVFIAELTLDNDAGLLRPGMQARAVIWGRSQWLGWTVIRRPCCRLARWMWW